MWNITLFFLLPFCLNFSSIHAYFLDETCTNRDIIGNLDIAESVGFAMDLAEEGRKAMLSDENQHITELRKWLFPDNEDDAIDNARILERVQLFRTLNQESTENVPQPTIYCDLSRYEYRDYQRPSGRTAQGLYSKISKRTFYSNSAIASYEDCKNGITFAYTARSVEDYDAEIQLCPWFLDKVGVPASDTLDSPNIVGGVPKRPDGVAPYDPTEDYKGKNTPHAMVFVDSLDSVLLHELTHALEKKMPGTTDYEYQWAECVADGFQGSGCFNANSYSFFAAGVYLISEVGIKWNKAGNVVALDAPTSKRDIEQLVMRLWSA